MRLNRLTLLYALLAALPASPALAGPWLQGDGDRFLSFSTEAVTSGGEIGEVFGFAYFEYGASETMTLGIDIGGTQDGLDKAVGFAKWSLGHLGEDIALAIEMGGGVSNDEPILRPGLSIGRGFPLGELSGWMTVKTLAHVELDNPSGEFTTDFTFGVNTSERSKLILQVQTGHQVDDLDFVKFAPSFVFERKTGQHVELGMLAGLENADDFAVKLGLWRKF